MITNIKSNLNKFISETGVKFEPEINFKDILIIHKLNTL